MSKRPSAPPPSAGFTLIELLIAIAIIAILSAMAWPTLQDAIHRSRRTDAMSALALIQHAQERWRANNPSYQATLTDLRGASTSVSPDGHYGLSLVEGSVTANSYAARATVRSTSPQSADSRCQWLQVSMTGGSIAYSSSSTDGVNAAPDPCWAR